MYMQNRGIVVAQMRESTGALLDQASWTIDFRVLLDLGKTAAAYASIKPSEYTPP